MSEALKCKTSRAVKLSHQLYTYRELRITPSKQSD